jgi:hypothetical protein
MHEGLPVAGYQPQTSAAIDRVNHNKLTEERLMRLIDALKVEDQCDQRCLALAKTYIEIGFMYLNRAIFKPGRVKLPDDPVA